MKRVVRLAVAFLLAAAAPAALMTAWYLYGQFRVFESGDPYVWVRTRGFLGLAFSIAAAFVFLLGVPTYLVLRGSRMVRGWSTLVAGFLLGAVPAALLTWPIRFSRGTTSSVNGVHTLIDGVPTLEAWMRFLEGVAFFGVMGLLASLVFWLTAPRDRGPSDRARGAQESRT